MAPIVTMDRRGRILLPSAMRKKMDLQPGAKFLITGTAGQALILVPLDVDTLVKRIREGMKGVDIDAEVARAKKEIRALAAEKYPDIARRLQRRQ